TSNIIVFNIPGSGPHTISPSSSLPAITQPLIIDGTTQPGFSNTPFIVIDGSSAGLNSTGFTINSNDCTIQSLVINNFSSGNGIQIDGTNNSILGCYIGTDASGTSAMPNSNGILITGSNNKIGGSDGLTNPQTSNIISGNTGNGIDISTSFGSISNTIIQ